MSAYSIQVYNRNDRKSEYFSYRSTDGWCRQNYKNENESLWKLLKCNPERNDHCYYIQYKYKWLSFDLNDNNKYIGVYSKEDHKSVWRLVSDRDNISISRIGCYHNGQFRGWLGVDKNRQWNKLVDDINDAVIYKIKKVH